MEAQKSVRKRSDGGNNQTSTITTLCRPSCNLEEKDTAHNAYGKRITSPHHCYRGLQKRVYEYN
jgi:hypothetical protein